jgi:hypothetical protein
LTSALSVFRFMADECPPFWYLQTFVSKHYSPIYALVQYSFKSWRHQGPLWSWEYGSWIYYYLCNQYLSPLTLRVQTRSCEVYSIQPYVIKVVSDLRQVSGFLRVHRFPPQIKFTATILLKYCWKWRLRHHNPNPLNHDVINWLTMVHLSSWYPVNIFLHEPCDYNFYSAWHNKTTTEIDWYEWRRLCYLTPLSKTLKLYRDGQFYRWIKSEYPEKTDIL